MTKKISLTGIKPTGSPHLGNYIGAIKPALEIANNKDIASYYFIADYHALISLKDPKVLKQYTLEVSASWLALGLDPNRTTLYLQSHIPEILELTWILNCFASKGLLNRAHAYKAALQKNNELKKDPDYGINMGLYSYPVLMAADILFIGSDTVPVGEDQLQHIEIARDIAQTINSSVGKTVLKLPKASINKETMVLPGLDGRKMSKSYNNHIQIFAPEKSLRKTIMKIKTDSTPPGEPKDPDNSLVFDLYSAFASKEQKQEMKKQFESGISWGQAKQDLFEIINNHVKDKRDTYNELIANPEKINKILLQGRDKVRPLAQKILLDVKRSIGYL
jgi:tryptophanyl-tRNA synthetase